MQEKLTGFYVKKFKQGKKKFFLVKFIYFLFV